jgi:hypothetical protein
VSNIGTLEWLQAQKADLEAELAAVNRLIERAGQSSNGHAAPRSTQPKPRKAVRRVRRKRHSFSPDPSSLASRVLNESRRILEGAGKAMSFAEMVQRLPRELVGTSQQRAYVRMILDRSGGRVGIDYVDADTIKLT